jgi:hypothetical protein
MKRIPLVLVVSVLLVGAMPATAGTFCEMTFSLSGWSVFYKTAKGDGVITCDNGQTARVKISSKGGGITAGKYRITDAIGKFTEVSDISELFGGYGQAEAHAGAGKSAKAGVVTKGEISLSFAGKGTGVDLGVAFGNFFIEKKK